VAPNASLTRTPGDGPIFRYRALVGAGALVPDPAQQAAAEALHVLHTRLVDYAPGRPKGGLRGLLRIGQPDPAPRGLYIFGDVGRGKSMLMDLFFEAAPVARKRRVHFHGFMAEVQDAIHDWRQKLKAGEVKSADPIPPVAAGIAGQAVLLCFDEFQVSDIADAMILGRLFERLFDLGVVVVATSNIAADHLYEGGLNRSLFVPFIALIKERMDILHLESPHDYRLDRLRAEPVYHAPNDAAARAALDQAWRDATAGLGERATAIELKGREIPVARAAGRAALFTFAELCEAPLGPRDYLAIAGRFDRIFITDVPVLGAGRRNASRRFINLIDTLYDARALVFITAEGEPADIVASGDESAAFRRTASRLEEMRSADYLERVASG
jgi:cell division protein ZapE